MVHPEYTKRIHNFIERVWREDTKSGFPIREMEDIPLEMEEAKTLFSQFFPELFFNSEGYFILKAGTVDRKRYWELLVKYYDREDLCKLLAGIEENPWRASHLVYAAELWQMALGDGVKALELLARAEEEACCFKGYLHLAQAWFGAFDDPDKGKTLLQEAEKHVLDTRDCCNLARSWAEDGKNPGEARRLLQGIPEPKKADEALTLARLEGEVFKNPTRARELLNKAEELIMDWLPLEGTLTQLRELFSLAGEHLRLFNDEDQARRLLELVGEICQGQICRDQRGLVELARHWMMLFLDENRARQALVKASGQLRRSGSSFLVSRTWVLLFDESSKVRPMLERWERDASTALELSFIAQQWRDLHGGEEKARARLREARSQIRDFKDELAVLVALALGFGEEEEARSIIRARETTAVGWEDHRNLARYWALVFQDHKQARRHLLKAEELTKPWSIEKQKVLAEWGTLLEDWKEVARILDKEENNFTGPRVFVLLAGLWKALKNHERARACTLKAVEASKSFFFSLESSDYAKLATLCYETLDDREQARLFLGKAVKKMKFCRESHRLVGKYIQWFDDEKSERRLLKKAEKKKMLWFQDPVILAEGYARYLGEWDKAEQLLAKAEGLTGTMGALDEARRRFDLNKRWRSQK